MKTTPIHVVLTFVLAGVVFFLDHLLPSQVIGSVAYVLVVAVAYGADVRGFPVIAASVCSLLAMLGPIVATDAQFQLSNGHVMANRLLTLFAIWVTAVLATRLQLLAGRNVSRSTSAGNNSSTETTVRIPPAPLQPSSQKLPDAGFLTSSITDTNGNPNDSWVYSLQVEPAELLDGLLSNVPESIAFKDVHGRYLRVSRAYSDRLGLDDPLDAIGKSDVEFFKDETARKSRDDELRVIDSGQPLTSIEECVTWANGREMWVVSTKLPLYDNTGTVVGTVNISRDISERKRAEAALEQSHARFRRLVDANIVGIMVARTDGSIMEANAEFLETVGWSQADLDAGRVRWDNMTPEEYRHLDERAVRVLAETGQCQPWEKEYIRKDGSRVPVLVGVTMLEPENAACKDCLCFVLDMTKQKRTEEQLRVARLAADSANHAKGSFLANMSHEIRTPMNAILGMTELLLDTSLSQTQREYLSIVSESGELLLTLINDILDFSKIEAGKLELDPQPFNVRDCVGDALRTLALRAHVKGLELVCDVAADVPHMMVGDKTRLRQIVLNLAGNAIKFTERGEVVVGVRSAAGSRHAVGKTPLQFSVRDTGVGIPEEKLAVVFDAFSQADASTTRKFGGTGLGLSISKRLVELMGGTISAESSPGEGSRFQFEVALPTHASNGAQPSLPAVRMLVVDDNAASRKSLEAMLRTGGATVESVPGVFEAFESLRAAVQNNAPIELVLCDGTMSDVDGFTLAERVQRDTDLAKHVVMMLSTADTPRDVARCEELGVASYTMKPVKQSDLFDAVLRAVGMQAAGEDDPSSHNYRGGVVGSLRVLLAEDSRANQRLAVGLLEKWGHVVTVVENGRDAVDAVSRSDFDLFISDLQMPIMDGLTATQEIRQQEPPGRRLPIIAMTAHAMVGDREKCLAAGMDDYVSKPISASSLQAAIARCAPKKKARNNASSIDWSAALRSVDGDRELLGSVAEAFLEEYPAILRGMEQAIENHQLEELSAKSHQLKSSLRTLGATQPATLAERLESLGQDASFDRAADICATLRKELDAAVRQIREVVTHSPQPN